MAQTFNLPAVGDTMVEAEIVEWLVEVGDEVALDQPICSIETDKSVVEMTTPYRGVVLALGGEEGDIVAVGEPLIMVGQPGEEPPEPSPAKTAAASAAATIAEHSEPGPAPTAAAELAPAPAAAPERTPGGTEAIRAMPKVRKLAAERSIDLATVTGTGPGGSITVADLDAAAPPAGGRRERLSATRRSIARHLTESAQQIPQFTSMVDADAYALLATRSALAQRTGAPVPLDAVLTALLVPVLKDHPAMNAMLDGDEIVYFDRYDIGIAVDTPDGLTLPVVHGADRLSVSEIAAEILRLAAAARDRTIQPADLTGPTATVNNVGPVGLLAGTPILPLGTSMIVAFGRARPVVQLRDGKPVDVPTMTISATFDHRIIDGGAAGRFLTQLKDHLEVPALGPLS